MTPKKQILVIDDEKGQNEEWKKWLETAMGSWNDEYEVILEQLDSVVTALNDLHQRRDSARKSQLLGGDKNLFDNIAILFVDYDLFDLDNKQDMTGELVAYLARCYSSCGLIVAVNQFEKGSKIFDLSLSGHPDAFADFHLSPEDLKNSGLWTEPWEGFRPWYWPHIPTAHKNFEARAQLDTEELDTCILEYFGFEEGFALSTSSLEFLTKKGKPEDVTFRSFVESSGFGLRNKDKTMDDKATARIAVSRLGKWLETLVLPGQNILVDAPHLAYRFPSLMGGNLELSQWNKVAHLAEPDGLALNQDVIAKFSFKKNQWLSRPAWFWQKISNLESLPEVADPWSTNRPDFVFCEDVSFFVSEDEAIEFAADLDSPFALRHIRKIDGVSYVPEFLLAL